MEPEEIEQINQLLQQYARYWNEGNIEALIDLYAEDAQLFCPFTPFRADGKETIRSVLEAMMQVVSKRILIHQPSTRVYHRTTIILTNYNSLVDENGRIGNEQTQNSQTWVKQGEQWLMVNHHVSFPHDPR